MTTFKVTHTDKRWRTVRANHYLISQGFMTFFDRHGKVVIALKADTVDSVMSVT